MIKLNKIDKYFNKNKKNEIHVLNDINLTFEQKGLTILLGPSGSGKTTLLNVVGGLDSVKSGVIDFNQRKIDKYKSKVWDEIRNRSVGYIFQNYYLLPHETVYDNIALTLKMIGITDPEEIDFRIHYVLEKVNMDKYRKRKANQLSGGQQQRVAIARALAKNPKVIIADEPTGNLDSKNTLEIMRIIKQISKEKLVILVTHEEQIADYYADRIIRLEDGRIVSDETHQSSTSLDVSSDSDIYLKDMHEQLNIKDQANTVSLHTDEDTELNIRLIVKNKTLYLDVNQDTLKKIHILDKNSEVKIYNQHRKEFEETQPDQDMIDVYDFEHRIKEPSLKKTQQVISVKESIKMAFKKIVGSSKLSKLLYFGFAGAAMVMALAIAMLANVVIIGDDEVLTMPKETLRIVKRDVTSYDAFMTITEEAPVYDYNMVERIFINFNFPTFFNTSSRDTLGLHAMSMAHVNQSDLTHGRLPEHAFEIVIDQLAADSLMNRQMANALGVDSYQAVLNLTVDSLSGLMPMRIVGIVDKGSPVAYVNEGFILTHGSEGLLSYEMLEPSFNLHAGRLIENANETLTLVPVGYSEPFEPGTITLQGQSFDVVGQVVIPGFDETIYLNSPILSNTDIERLLFESFSQSQPLYLYADNTNQLERFLTARDIESENIFEVELEQLRAERLRSSRGLIIFTVLAIFASALSFYFIIRSSMISRIYEIGVYRSLGVGKLDLLKLFVIEAIMITSMSSLLGFIFMNYILVQIHNASREVIQVLHVSPLTIGLGALMLYGIHVVSSIIPIGVLLRKTPAQINAQYDL